MFSSSVEGKTLDIAVLSKVLAVTGAKTKKIRTQTFHPSVLLLNDSRACYFLKILPRACSPVLCFFVGRTAS